MSDTETRGGFTGDPSTAPTVTGAGGCCGNPPQATLAFPEPAVSQHLKILTEVRFVLVEAVGTARHYRINTRCIECFPSAADVVMGRPAPTATGGDA